MKLCLSALLVLSVVGAYSQSGKTQPIRKVAFKVVTQEQSLAYGLFVTSTKNALSKNGCVIDNSKSRHLILIRVEPESSYFSGDFGAFRCADATVTGKVTAIRDGITLASEEFDGSADLDPDKITKKDLEAGGEKLALPKAIDNAKFSDAVAKVVRKAFAHH